MTAISAPETKGTPELGYALDDLLRAFETYKEENDRRLSEVETRGAADPLTIEKLDRLDRALDDHKRRIDEMTLCFTACSALRTARPRHSRAQGCLRRLRPQGRGDRPARSRRQGAVGRLRS